MTTMATPTQSIRGRTRRRTTTRSPSRRAAKRAKSAIFHVVALALTGVVLYPALWMVASSFKPNAEIGGANTSLWSNNFSFDNFVTAMDGIGGVSTLQFFTNSLVLAIGAVVGTILSRQRLGLRLRPDQVPGPQHLLRHDDRHPAPALPRGDHSAVHRLPAAGPRGHLRPAADRQVPRRGRVLRVPDGPVHAQPPGRTGRGGPHRRRRPRPDLHLHHAAR